MSNLGVLRGWGAGLPGGGRLWDSGPLTAVFGSWGGVGGGSRAMASGGVGATSWGRGAALLKSPAKGLLLAGSVLASGSEPAGKPQPARLRVASLRSTVRLRRRPGF